MFCLANGPERQQGYLSHFTAEGTMVQEAGWLGRSHRAGKGQTRGQTQWSRLLLSIPAARAQSPGGLNPAGRMLLPPVTNGTCGAGTAACWLTGFTLPALRYESLSVE